MIDTFKYNGSIGLNKNTDLLRKAGLNGMIRYMIKDWAENYR